MKRRYECSAVAPRSVQEPLTTAMGTGLVKLIMGLGDLGLVEDDEHRHPSAQHPPALS